MKDKETIFPNKCDTIDQQKREIEKLKAEIYDLKERNKKLSKRHPTTEEALEQYHWLKQNSRRNKDKPPSV